MKLLGTLNSSMDKNHEWVEEITKQISMQENKSGFLNRRKWQLPLLRRLVVRIDDFSGECEECRDIKYKLKSLSRYLANPQQIAWWYSRTCQTTIRSIVHHLRRKHRLVNEKQYTKRFVSTSFLIGLFIIILGHVLISFGNTILALSITIPALFARVIFGYTIGYLLDFRAKRQGRVI